MAPDVFTLKRFNKETIYYASMYFGMYMYLYIYIYTHILFIRSISVHLVSLNLLGVWAWSISWMHVAVFRCDFQVSEAGVQDIAHALNSHSLRDLEMPP